MKKSLAFILTILIGLSALAACTSQKSDIANATTKKQAAASTEAEKSSVTENGSSPELPTTTSTTETSSHATDESDNDVDFNEFNEVSSDKVTNATSSAVKPSTTLNETADTASSKGGKSKITTDKDGWVNKWY